MDDRQLKALRADIRQLERVLGGVLDLELHCCGVTTAQCHSLLAIEEKQPTTLTALAAELGLDKSTLSRTINCMSAAGLVERKINDENRRSQHLRLTTAGEKITAAIHLQWNEYYRRLLRYIPTEKQPLVLEGIRLLAQAISANKACCRPRALAQPGREG